jgi:hypothetical protein
MLRYIDLKQTKVSSGDPQDILLIHNEEEGTTKEFFILDETVLLYIIIQSEIKQHFQDYKIKY